MKKVIMLGVALTTMAASSLVFANPAIFKKHQDAGKKEVNCATCHDKAGIKKEKGQDTKKLQSTNETCKGCHAK